MRSGTCREATLCKSFTAMKTASDEPSPQRNALRGVQLFPAIVVIVFSAISTVNLSGCWVGENSTNVAMNFCLATSTG